MGTTAALLEAMDDAVGEIRKWPSKEVRLFHHNDSAGLSSGAILTQAFQRAGFEVRRSCLEKPYPKLPEPAFDQQARTARPPPKRFRREGWRSGGWPAGRGVSTFQGRRER